MANIVADSDAPVLLDRSASTAIDQFPELLKRTAHAISERMVATSGKGQLWPRGYKRWYT